MGNLAHVLKENVAAPESVSIFGLFQVSEPILVCWIISAALMLFAVLATRKLKRIPGKGQALLELCIGSFNNFCRDTIGQHWRSFAPWLFTVSMFILSCNLIGIFGFTPPTKALSITGTLAICSVVLIYGAQFRFRGLKGGLHKFIEPVPVLLPINLLEVLIRPLSLCMRLFGNILATFLIMEMIKTLVPIAIPAVFALYFDLFDGVIQAVVFVFLTMLFIAEAVEEHEDKDKHAHKPLSPQT